MKFNNHFSTYLKCNQVLESSHPSYWIVTEDCAQMEIKLSRPRNWQAGEENWKEDYYFKTAVSCRLASVKGLSSLCTQVIYEWTEWRCCDSIWHGVESIRLRWLLFNREDWKEILMGKLSLVEDLTIFMLKCEDGI